MLIILASVITAVLHYYVVGQKSFDDFPIQANLGCDECLRIYFPLCATDNLTYTNECRFRCIMSKKEPEDRAEIGRFGPCILGA